MSQRMLDAFIAYEREQQTTMSINQSLIGMPLGTRLMRILRRPGCWHLWLATRDYVYGTFIIAWDDGHVERITTREDEGDEVIRVRPSDEEISRWTRSSGSSSTEE